VNIETSLTAAEAAEQVAGYAQASFRDHVAQQLGPGEWLCKKPGTGIYHFFVISRSGTLIVYGDIGEWILQMSEKDPTRWLPGAIRSPGYFFEKMRAADISGGGRDEFYLKDALADLQHRAAESRENGRADGGAAGRALEELADFDADELSREQFCSVLYEAGCEEFGRMGVGPSGRSLWLLEAMKWFVANVLNEAEPAAAAGGAA
jgi:hypothetical protein